MEEKFQKRGIESRTIAAITPAAFVGEKTNFFFQLLLFRESRKLRAVFAPVKMLFAAAILFVFRGRKPKNLF